MKWSDTGEGGFEQPPTGTHLGICVHVIDIGTQRSEYQGQANIRRQCIIGWELPNELMTGEKTSGKPFLVSRFYTASLNEKSNLRADLRNWRGRDFTESELDGFESKNILGKSCMLSITPNDKGKSKITGVMALPKGTQVPTPQYELVFFSLDGQEFDHRVFDGLSDGIKKIIQRSPEYERLTRQTPAPAAAPRGATFDEMDDDIPF